LRSGLKLSLPVLFRSIFISADLQLKMADIIQRSGGAKQTLRIIIFERQNDKKSRTK
jgi:hypothetical protein